MLRSNWKWKWFDEKRGYFSFCNNGNVIYIFGGYNEEDNDWCNDLWMIDCLYVHSTFTYNKPQYTSNKPQ